MKQLQLPVITESNWIDSHTATPSTKRLIGCMVKLAPAFQELLINVFKQPRLWECFVSAPSSCIGHHCEKGGNVRHTVEVVELAITMALPFRSLVDEDVLITAALLHDLGKALEYVSSHSGHRMSMEGKLVGHRLNGYALVCNALAITPGISRIQSLGLRNCLTASEWPRADARGIATLEGTILRKAAQLSAAADLFRRSYASMTSDNGLGTPHPHLQETPWHIKAKLKKVRTPREMLREHSIRRGGGTWRSVSL